MANLQNFVQVPCELIDNPNISNDAKILFIKMLQKPPAFKIIFKNLLKENGLSETTQRRQIAQLKKFNWITSEKQKLSCGKKYSYTHELRRPVNFGGLAETTGVSYIIEPPCILSNKPLLTETGQKRPVAERELKLNFAALLITAVGQLRGQIAIGTVKRFFTNSLVKGHYKDWQNLSIVRAMLKGWVSDTSIERLRYHQDKHLAAYGNLDMNFDHLQNSFLNTINTA